MNIVSTIVGLSIAGTACPMLLDMSLAPVIAQKRATNFGEAELLAVTYAAHNEGASQLTQAPPDCILDQNQAPAYTIKCARGANQFIQIVSRSFIGKQSTRASSTRTFQYPAPTSFTHDECRSDQDWGINTAAFDNASNKWVAPSCMPHEIRHQIWYDNSDPNSWRYDINNFDGFGQHPGYQ